MTKKVSRSRFWFYLLYPVVCFYVFVYPVARLLHWYDPEIGFGWLAMFVLWATSVVGLWYSFSGPKMVVRYFVVHWMGVSFIFSTLTLIAEGVRLALNGFDSLQQRFADTLTDTMIAQIVLMAGVIIIVGTVLFSHHMSVKQHHIRSPKLSRNRRIVQISDVHIGSRQAGYMRRIVNKINKLEPDFVVITGDLIDSSAVSYEALSSLGTLNAQTYFSIGNHERYADLEKILDIAERLGITTLRQQSERQGELIFVGIDDADRRDQVGKMLPGIDLHKPSYQILLYHRPVGWRSAMEHDIDLMLSGHTHNGQIFPFNYLVKQQFKRMKGMFVEGEYRLYVSVGTGTWGPLMRLGSMNEISVFDLGPESDR